MLYAKAGAGLQMKNKTSGLARKPNRFSVGAFRRGNKSLVLPGEDQKLKHEKNLHDIIVDHIYKGMLKDEVLDAYILPTKCVISIKFIIASYLTCRIGG